MKRTVALLGNPNSGKTTLFNRLTGSRRQVGNWPGVTVEKVEGFYTYDNCVIHVVDLPGTYSLDVYDKSISIDESIARDFIASQEADLIVNIINASQLERNLYLTSQILDSKTPVILVLNMMDVAVGDGIVIDTQLLSSIFNCTVCTIVAKSDRDVHDLKKQINIDILQGNKTSKPLLLGDSIERAINNVQKTFINNDDQNCSRLLSIGMLSGSIAIDTLNDKKNREFVLEEQRQLVTVLREDVDILVANARYESIGQVVSQVEHKTPSGNTQKKWTERIDRIVLDRFLGIPIFFGVMYLMFLFSVSFGRVFTNFFEAIAGVFFIDSISYGLSYFEELLWLKTLAMGIGVGIQTIASFIPIIACLFLFLSILEDSGYMVRAAFVMDRFLKKVGLSGKALVPLIVGFGCNVPAIMATRTLEDEQSRMLTIAMVPFMSCGARLPVYAVFSLVFFPTTGHNVAFVLYCTGILAALFTGLIVRKFILQGDCMPMLMELPGYHMPSFQNICSCTWGKLKGFVLRAGKVIVVVVMLLHVMNSISTDGSFNISDPGSSLLSTVGRMLTPVFKPMGISEENWPATVGIITGIMAKEVVVGTLNSLYQTMLVKPDGTGEISDIQFDFWHKIFVAFDTISYNVKRFWHNTISMFSISSPVFDLKQTVEEEGFVADNFSVMRAMFPNKASVIAYLLLILLYTPCVSALGAIYRETNLIWMLFISGWTFVLGYGTAVLYYQIAVFSERPGESALWICFIILLIVAMIWQMKRLGNKVLMVSS